MTGWGLSAERIGTVKTVDANDEMLWAQAQIDRNHRYRAYIAKLVEQGAFKADPMWSPHLTRRDRRGLLSALPVAGIELSPQGIAA